MPAREAGKKTLRRRGDRRGGYSWNVSRVVAVVGASRSRHKFGNKAVRAFSAAGDTVIPIHPFATEIEGKPAFKSVLDVPGPIDMATVYLPPAVALTVLPDFKRKGIGEVWLNPGADEDAVVDEARRLGLNAIVACSIMGAGMKPSDY